jgi:hypothetical protein
MAAPETALPYRVNVFRFIDIVARNHNPCVIMNIVANEGTDIFTTCVFNNIAANREKMGPPFLFAPEAVLKATSLFSVT